MTSEQELLEKQRTYWNRRASELEDRSRTGIVGHYRRLELGFVAAHLRGGRILDCGCGDGLFLGRLRRLFFWKTFIGIDFSEEMIGAGLARHPGAELSVMDMTALQFGDRAFDTVYAVRSLKNLLSQDLQHRAIRELARVTRSTAVIVDSIVDGNTEPVPEFNLYLCETDLLRQMAANGLVLLRKLYFRDPRRFWRPQSVPAGNEGFFAFRRRDD